MDIKSEERNRREIDHIRHYCKSLYVAGSGSNINLNEFCSDPKRNQRSREQSTGVFKSNYNEDGLYCGMLNTKNTVIINPRGYNSLLSEPRNSSQASSDSICLRCLRTTETKCHPGVYSNSKIVNESNIKQTCNNHNQVREDLHERQEKLFSDKTTYCRPVVNLYHQEFLYKTIEKNAKLRKLVTELVTARQKEKDRDNWNSYINELRKKHCRYPKVKRANSLQYISEEFEVPHNVEDLYNTKFTTCKQSNYCQNLLQDFYKSHDIKPSYLDYCETPNEYARTPPEYRPFKTNPLCYPTSSQGRLIMLERERLKQLANRGYKPLHKTINEEKNHDGIGLKTISRKTYSKGKSSIICNNRSTNTVLKCTSTQTEFQIVPSRHLKFTKGCNTNQDMYKKGSIKELHIKETAQEKISYIDNNNLRKSSLVSIEKKIDNLIHSINNFMVEIKTKRGQRQYVDQRNKLGKENVNHTKSDTCGIAPRENIVYELFDTDSQTTRNSSIDNFNRIRTINNNLNKINDILSKEIGKNKPITLNSSSVRETHHPCSVQISVTIPTKEISTEVTRSLSKAGNLGQDVVIEEIPREDTPGKDRQIAIAVNTDPMSLLAMLRVSTEETIKRLLSYVPTIDYYSYLFKLQGPAPRIVESHYICNICGAAFRKPSALTDHIQKHELGVSRDCCVCRHVLDVPRRRPGLFKCQYCGQRFTRAYCCELHQEACAKRLGKLHDVSSNLILLR